LGKTVFPRPDGHDHISQTSGGGRPGAVVQSTQSALQPPRASGARGLGGVLEAVNLAVAQPKKKP
jgi:hypothetical protein